MKEINLSALHILVVDDDLGVLNYLSTVLERYGCVYQTASSAGEAIKGLKKQKSKWDLVITDVVLSDGNGIDIVKECQKMHPAVPVLLISGYPPEKLQEYGVDSAAHFLEKPFQPEELRYAIYELFTKQKQGTNRTG